MTWDRPIDPSKLYQRWDTFNRVFAPGPAGQLLPAAGFPADMLATGITSVLSLTTGRRELWAATCLSAGYASQSDTDAGSAMFELAGSTIYPWPDVGVGQFSASYNSLGWEPQVVVNSARLLTAAIPHPLLALAGVTVSDIEVCFDTCGGDMDAILECIRAATAARARLGQ